MVGLYCAVNSACAQILPGSQTFSGKLEFIVKDCDPETGEADEEGYEDSYTVGHVMDLGFVI